MQLIINFFRMNETNFDEFFHMIQNIFGSSIQYLSDFIVCGSGILFHDVEDLFLHGGKAEGNPLHTHGVEEFEVSLTSYLDLVLLFQFFKI